MALLVGLGTLVSIVGLMGLLLCIRKVAKAKNNGASDEALRKAVRSVLPLNLGSLLLSALGLMTVVIGVIMSS